MATWLNEQDVRAVLSPADLIGAIERALSDFSRGEVAQPVRSVIGLGEQSFFGVMPALYRARDILGAKLVTVVPANAGRGLHTHQAVIALFDPTTGVYWASDAFASPMPTPVRTADELEHSSWIGGIHTFARYVSPWLELVDERRFQRTVDRVAALAPSVITGCHTPIIGSAHVEHAMATTRRSPAAAFDPPPDQSVLDEIQRTFLQMAAV